MKVNSKEGYLYILYHPSFLSYGENVYKLGMTINPKQRLQSYSTSFLHQAIFLFISDKLSDCYKAEKVLFYLLRSERVATNREFFVVDLKRCEYMIRCIGSLSPYELSFMYTKVCWNVVPLKVKLAFETCDENEARQNIEEELSKWSSNEWTQNIPYDEFLERYRFRPSRPEMYPEYILPEIKELHILQACAKANYNLNMQY
jgi:hypothetical protein